MTLNLLILPQQRHDFSGRVNSSRQPLYYVYNFVNATLYHKKILRVNITFVYLSAYPDWGLREKLFFSLEAFQGYV